MRYLVDFAVIGGGIAGLLSAYFLQRDYKVIVVDKRGLLKGASGAAGAFLFPKVGKKSKYTDFINSAIVKAIKFYEEVGVRVYKKGVLILPRDKRDIEKFKEYEKFITLPFEKKDGGFFFDIGSVINPEDVKDKLKVDFIKAEFDGINKEGEYFVIGDIKAKNLILARGYEEDIEYLKIRPIWGERIEISGKWDKIEHFYHKNCSVGEVNGRLKIGATHKRDCLECKENEKEAMELIAKAREIINIYDFKIEDIKGGFRAGSVDYFPIVDKVINIDKTLTKAIVKGALPRSVTYENNLYVINGMGGRGFSNAYICAKMLYDYIKYNKKPSLNSLRLFIKWARRDGEEYLDAKSS